MSGIADIKASTLLGTLMRTTSATVGFDTTFNPMGFIPGTPVARWVDRSGGIAVGYPAYTLLVRPPNKGSRLFRVQSKLAVPTLETLGTSGSGFTPPPTKAYELMGNLEVMIPERSTATERATFFSLLTSLMLGTINASDDLPTDLTGSPLPGAILDFDAPF